VRIARFSHQDAIRYGIVDDGELVVLAGDPMFAGYDTTGERVPLADAALLAPVIPRSKVVAVGRNYRAHAEELGNEVPPEPMLFFKPNTAVIGPGDVIVRPRQSSFTSFEGELAVVIGSIAKNVAAERASEVIFGYTIANDITARDLQKTDGQWARAKGFDTFCPLGPWIETDLDACDAEITVSRNGHALRGASTRDLARDVVEVLVYVTSVLTLGPGDVVLTGAPGECARIRPGDTVEITVAGLGTLANPVVAAPVPALALETR
jgi:2-keto-4-pentenoate hydratase/2-oxohepta-3-ene-1,7-dioic acid hydratase in catechol pathway